MNDQALDRNTRTVTRLLEDLFEIGAILNQQNHLVVSLQTRFEKHASLKMISERLKMAGYDFSIDEHNGQILLSINPRPKFRIPRINVILFLLTLISVYFVPVFLNRLPAIATQILSKNPDQFSVPMSLWDELALTATAAPEAFKATLDALAHGAGIEFTLALISILFVHEMGHFIASRRRDIVTSWPYFIPAPNIIGTFGAIIKSKSPFWSRRDLIEVGAAGPIAGWIVAVGWLWYGLSRSTYLPQEAFQMWDMAFSMDGESILMRLSALLLVGQAPAGYFYKLTEAAFAGWVGLLVTAINLLPIGQLDGGHIVYGLSRQKQYFLGIIAMGILLVLGLQSGIWWFFALFGFIFGIKHPPTLNDYKNPGKTAVGMGLIAIFILIISFTPVPFQ